MSSPTIEDSAYEALGRRFTGRLAWCASVAERRPGIIICHGGAGPGEHELQVADRLARLGYVALVADLFGERFTSREHGIAVIQELMRRPEDLLARAGAALLGLAGHRLVADDRLAAIGYCFGGMVALELARSGAKLACVASIHGRLSPRRPSEGPIGARILVCAGADDPFVTPADRQAFEEEMIARGADWQMLLLSGAQHGFADRHAAPAPGVAYHARSADRAWRAMVGHFAESFGPIG